MYIDFQQNQVCRSVKIVHTNLFAQYRKLHKFATTNSIFEKKKILLDMHHHKRTCIAKTQVMTVHTTLFTKKLQLHKFATTNKYFF